jgi:hypothetical protein
MKKRIPWMRMEMVRLDQKKSGVGDGNTGRRRKKNLSQENL